MERESRLRKATRGAFTRILNTLKVSIEASNPDKQAVQVSYLILEERAAELKQQDDEIKQLLLDDDNADLEGELDGAESYQRKFLDMRVSVTHILNSPKTELDKSVLNLNSTRKFKLPTLEFRKFGDDLKDWLPFWSQFQKIDQDEDIAPEDKFQYLIQATVEGSRAREVVDSFPPTSDNYSKAVESLKARFGRDDLLVEVYVRELLKLIISMQRDKDCLSISSLYDKLESYIRALSTLGVTTEKCSAMLFPLVESCFPEEFLKAWHRSAHIAQVGDAKDRLNKLMDFLKSEVEGEERISLAMAGFGLEGGTPSPNIKKKTNRTCFKNEIPTATGLLSTSTVSEKRKFCAFCEGRHTSAECFAAQKMSIAERQKRLREKGCCFACLKPGHHIRRCKANLRCIVCGKKHVTLMCEGLKPQSTQQSSEEKDLVMTSLTRNPKVFLQTLKVKLRSDEREMVVRALMDTGSQRSYILKDTAKRLGYVPVRQETVAHSLFGGGNTELRQHNCYKAKLSELNGKFRCNFDVLDQEVICGEILPIGKGSWLPELKKKRIHLTDVSSKDPEPIEILIGADVLGKLLTGRRVPLSCGLVAVETCLGWTLMGKVPQAEVSDMNIAMMVTSLFVKEADISNLWRMDLIGITDPVEKKSKEEKEFITKEHFLRTVEFNQEGHYEVRLPWTNDHLPLPDNLCLAKKRLNAMTKKLMSEHLYDDYEDVFREWLSEGIIEEVPMEEIGSYGHYLPHRPVIKESSSTTRIRPVFDASARLQHHPSLNQCLECGPNLIELIPDILLRFRMKRIGVVADIRKAFLQISLCKEDRDFLRFLWWENIEEEKYKMFRHTRVVFGVKCSPFLLGAVIEYHLKKNIDFDPLVLQQLLKNFYVDNLVTSVDNREELQQLTSGAIDLMSKGGFDLRNWEHSEEKPNEKSRDLTPVLGLLWDRHSDVLRINVDWFQEGYPDVVTKRTMLSTAHKIFDPLGLTSPVMLCPKLMLQKTWRLGIGWDDEVPDALKQEFLDWLQELPVLKNVCVPRWSGITLNNVELCSIHTFCDASQDAYAAVVYLRIEKGNQKAWICLFTCAVYRAVHLELVTAISTEAFLLALRRFIARRGRCSIIYCDNGTNFVGAANLLKTLDWNYISQYSAINSIEWKFNPPTAAWWGGWWERMIRIMKNLLRRVLGRACLTYEELSTVLCDCEAIINSRPLTYITECDSDLVPLSPSVFLQDIKEWGVPDLDAADHRSLNRRVKYRHALQKDLRNRFRSEYLGLLVQRHSTKDCRPVAVGEIVLIGSDNCKRLNWPIGQVTEVIPGKDGTIRLVKLKTSHAEIIRPVQRVYPLEVSAMETFGASPEVKLPKLVSTKDRPPNHCKKTDSIPVPFKSETKRQVTTRMGRVVKIPERLDL